MHIQRLKWAGLRLEAAGRVILLDAVENFAAFAGGAAVGQVDQGGTLVSGATTQADYILLTHLHPDHYDPQLIRACLRPEGLVLCLDAVADALRADGLDRVVGLALGQEFQQGELKMTAVYAMDGFGDPQCSWVVADGAHRILHGGDTLWHNQFWALGTRYPSFDAVFLPINGAVAHLPHLAFSPVPATLTPLQAVSAAQLLHARQLVPIHYGLYVPGHYEEYPDALAETQRLAAELGVPLRVLANGQELSADGLRNPVASEG